MSAHLFIVDHRTFPVHRDYQFCGVVNHQNWGVYADIKRTRVGDTVFFYEEGKGFHGIYEISGAPFFDTSRIEAVGDDLPIRVPIKCKFYFPKPVPEDFLFNTPGKQRIFWTIYYRKLKGARSCTPVTPESEEELIKLLIQVNGSPTPPPSFKAYPKGFQPKPLKLKLQGANNRVPREDILMAWFMENIDASTSDLRAILGPSEHIEWFGNWLTHDIAMKAIDILVYHKFALSDKPAIRYKFSVLELKRDQATIQDVIQVLKYAKWVSLWLANNEPELVQPIVVANAFRREAIERAKQTDFNQKGVMLVKYEVIEDDISLKITNNEQLGLKL